jgi:hypothetical protein
VNGQIHVQDTSTSGKNHPLSIEKEGPTAGLDHVESIKFVTLLGSKFDPSVVQPVGSWYSPPNIWTDTEIGRVQGSSVFKFGRLTSVDNRLIDGDEPVSLTRRQRFTPTKEDSYPFLLQAELTPGSQCVWRIRQTEKFNLIGYRTSDLPACGIVHQQTTLTRALSI